MLEQQPVSRSKASENSGLVYDCLVFGMNRNRPELYRRIDERVDAMLANGLVTEVENLLAAGFPAETTAMQAIGYKEMACHIWGKLSLEEAAAQIKQSSRRYAKRQLTWFRRMPYIRWIDMDEGKTGEDVLANMGRQVAEKFSIR
jgi:tRNA dimethylallyltransferase